MFIYVDPTDNMNKRSFRGFVTGHYEPRLPKRFIKHDQRPIYPDIDQWAEARVTPAMIVDMFFHGKEFSIPDMNDMKQIIMIINSYVEYAESLKIANGELRVYLAKCKKALEALKDAYNRMDNYQRNVHPNAFKRAVNAFDLFYDKLKSRKNT